MSVPIANIRKGLILELDTTNLYEPPLRGLIESVMHYTGQPIHAQSGLQSFNSFWKWHVWINLQDRLATSAYVLISERTALYADELCYARPLSNPWLPITHFGSLHEPTSRVFEVVLSQCGSDQIAGQLWVEFGSIYTVVGVSKDDVLQHLRAYLFSIGFQNCTLSVVKEFSGVSKVHEHACKVCTRKVFDGDTKCWWCEVANP